MPNYQSNIEKILANWLGAGVTEDAPASRIEDLLIQVRNASAGGVHYEVVDELPTTGIQTNVIYFVPKSDPQTGDYCDEYINTTGDSSGWELIGSTSVNIDIDSNPTQGSDNAVSSGGVYTALSGKQDTLTFDSVPTDGSTNPVESNGVYDALAGKQNTLTFDSVPTDGSTNPVESNGLYDALSAKMDKTEHADVTLAEYSALPDSKLTNGVEYFITDADAEKERIVYGFRVDPDESNSEDAVTYLDDAVGMTPAYMGETAFNYGSWGDAWFIPKPCMLGFNGVVDYYLDPNDYSKKADGTPSDYNNLAYNGNAMMEWSLIWFKFGNNEFHMSNVQVDNSYDCPCNKDANGNIIKHFYVPIYNGVIYDGKMRSISGIKLRPWSATAYSSSATYAVGDVVNYNFRMWECKTAVETAEAFDESKWEQFAFNGNTTGEEEVAAATACNTTAAVEWYTDVLCDRQLLNALHILISKSIDSQGRFGRGIDSGSQAAKENYVTGSLDDKGLFYGSTANGTTAVKTFGIENWWALVWRRTAGLIGSANGYKYKMTGPYDSSGTNYTEATGRPNTSNYVKKMIFGDYGMLPTEVVSYSTQYYKDYYYSGTGHALVGGVSFNGANCGAFFFNLRNSFSNRNWSFAASPSCKPLRERG